MDAVTFGQIIYILIMLGVTLTAAGFTYLSPIKDNRQSHKVINYFAGFFFCTCFAFSSFLIRPFIDESISIFFTNILFLTNLYLLKHGLMWRKGIEIDIYKNKPVFFHVVLFVSSQLMIHRFVQDYSFWLTVNLAINSIGVLATMLF